MSYTFEPLVNTFILSHARRPPQMIHHIVGLLIGHVPAEISPCFRALIREELTDQIYWSDLHINMCDSAYSYH